jgi:hypothetical protein
LCLNLSNFSSMKFWNKICRTAECLHWFFTSFSGARNTFEAGWTRGKMFMESVLYV